jgi:oligopeptide transport system substrate-binding protein
MLKCDEGEGMKKLFVVVLAVLLLSGCVEKKSVDKGVLDNAPVFNINRKPAGLLLMNEYERSQKDILYTLFEGLVTMNAEGDISPALAKSWSVSEDGLEYSFEICENALWSDGSKITAGDFVDFFSLILDPKTDNIYDYQLYCISGAEDYSKKRTNFTRVGVKAKSEEELIIRLNAPTVDFLNIISQPIYGLRKDKELLEQWQQHYGSIKYTGPFTVMDIKEDGNIVLKKNSYYREAEGVKSDYIILSVSKSDEAAFVAYEMDKVNIVQNPPLSEVKNIINNQNTVIAVLPDIISLSFNMRNNSPGKDINFRKAVYEAINPLQIVEKALPEYNIGTGGFLHSGVPNNIFAKNAFKSSSDDWAAREYIDSMADLKPRTITLIGESSDINKQISRVIAARIREALDIRVQFALYGSEELSEVVKEGNYDLLLGIQRQEYSSEISLLEKWTTGHRKNKVKYSNSVYDRTLSAARRESSSLAREELLARCRDILEQDMPCIYLFNDARIIVKSSNIYGLHISPLGNIDLKGAYRTDYGKK